MIVTAHRSTSPASAARFARRITRREHFPVPERLAQRPDLWVVDDFLSETEIAAALARVGSPQWVGRHALHVIADAKGFAAEVPGHGKGLFGSIVRRMEGLTGLRSGLPRTLRFKYNANGQGHAMHSDAFTHRGHHVVLSSLVYLTDVEVGGETEFPHALPGGVAVVPRRGRLLVWTSLDADGNVDPAAFHGAAPVASGEKAILVGFTALPRGNTVTRLSPRWPVSSPRGLRRSG